MVIGTCCFCQGGRTECSARPRRVWRVSLATFACLGVAACAQPPAPSPLLELRPRLGTITVAIEPSGMPVIIGSPARGGEDGALQGAGQGLLLGVAVSAGMAGTGAEGAIAGLLLGAATAVVAAPIGAIAGAAQARSKSEVEAAERTLKKALAETPPGAVSSREARCGRTQTPYNGGRRRRGAGAGRGAGPIPRPRRYTSRSFGAALWIAPERPRCGRPQFPALPRGAREAGARGG